jgi:hypothetical protein
MLRHRRPASGRTRRVIPDGLSGGGSQACDGGDLEAAELHACVAAVAGLVSDADVAPGQGGELVVQGGLVGLDGQQLGGVLTLGGARRR